MGILNAIHKLLHPYASPKKLCPIYDPMIIDDYSDLLSSSLDGHYYSQLKPYFVEKIEITRRDLTKLPPLHARTYEHLPLFTLLLGMSSLAPG